MIAEGLGFLRLGVDVTLPVCNNDYMSNHNNSGANMTTKCKTPDELRKQPVTVTLTDGELFYINLSLHNRMVTLPRGAESDYEMDILVSAVGKIEAARRA